MRWVKKHYLKKGVVNMQQSKVLDYIESKGWDFIVSGDDNLMLKSCPYCEREETFGINKVSGLFQCFSENCRSENNSYGHLDKLKSYMGDLVVKEKVNIDAIPLENVQKGLKALLESKVACDYMKARGITPEALKYFKIGYKLTQGEHTICIPHFQLGNCVNYKFRKINPVNKKDRFSRIKGRPSILFNQDNIDYTKPLILEEGELDAISWWVAGHSNVCSLVTGAGSKPLNGEMYDVLDKHPGPIIIRMDDDVAGSAALESIAVRLGKHRCKKLVFNGSDTNKILQDKGPAHLLKLLDKAEDFKIDGILDSKSSFEKYKDQFINASAGIDTPWVNVNRVLGHKLIQPGHIVLLGAKPGVGKTSFSLQQAVYTAKKGIPTLFYCLEMDESEIMEKVVAHYLQKDLGTISYNDIERVERELLSGEFPFFCLDMSYSTTSVEDTLSRITQTIKRYGIELCVFDHIHFLSGGKEHAVEEKLANEFKVIAKSLKTAFIVLAHPTKSGARGSDKDPNKVMEAFDIKGSSALQGVADTILIMHRDSIISSDMEGAAVDDDSDFVLESPKVLVRSGKSRHGQKSECYLYLDGSKCTFYTPQQWDSPLRGRLYDRPEKTPELSEMEDR